MDQPYYKYQIALADITTSEAVIEELKKLDQLLVGSDLYRLSVFNRAYIVVTEKINQASVDGEFSNPELMEILVVAFASKYFQALNQYAQHGVLPGAWQKVHRGWLYSKHPASLSLLLGANAHINHDLIHALKESIDCPREFEEDYFKVNHLLVSSSSMIANSYREPGTVINLFKKRLGGAYMGPVMSLILSWRTKTWYELV